MQIRLFGAPAVLLTLVIFGALRGQQDMRTPLWIALGVNGLNIVLDWLLIFGSGSVPALGVAGSALASTISQWLGALAGIYYTARKIPLTPSIHFRDTTGLLRVGRDIFIRTGVLNLFLIYTTRVANNLGANSGAAHQVIRQMWVFTALAMDAFAASAQSLVGYFVGQRSISSARQVARVGLIWSVGTGITLGGLMWAGRDILAAVLVPPAALSLFLPAWGISALSQPINSLAFLTDGIHWGTGDYRYLRNAMLIASLSGMIGIWIMEQGHNSSLTLVWGIIAGWNLLRGTFGVVRIWPGIGQGIFKKS
jgi:MATE family multidrug resistance protein